MAIRVHLRIHERHPEIEDQDMIDAFNTTISKVSRLETDPIQEAGVGVDSKGRLIEYVATSDGKEKRDWLIWHGGTPPTKKFLKEVGLGGR